MITYGLRAGEVAGLRLDDLDWTIKTIEIQDSHLNLVNNLVFWQNRFGHANRDHRALLDATLNRSLRGTIERLLFSLYRGGSVCCSGTVRSRCQEAVCRTRRSVAAWLFSSSRSDTLGYSRIKPAIGDQFATWAGAPARADNADGAGLDHACSALTRRSEAVRSRRARASS